MIKKNISFRNISLAILFLLGLIYMTLPIPHSIGQFSPLPDSTKSNLPGDTWQNPNIAAYFSNYNRQFVTGFYRQNLASLDLLGKIFPPIRFNHPPEDAYQFIRDQQESTFLEEYTYPLRESLFVNGFQAMLTKDGQTFSINDYFNEGGKIYSTKTTIRYYPSALWARLVTYLGIWAGAVMLFVMTRRVLKSK